MMKSGPNFQDINKIKRMAAEGVPAEEISRRLLINLKAVLPYVDDEAEEEDD